MHGKIVFASLLLGLSASIASAQANQSPLRGSDLECSGIVTTESVPRDTYVITGEASEDRITFDEGDYVYVNKGSDQGVKVGDEFSVIRSIKDPYGIEWTKWQWAILKKMGTVWEDEARVKVAIVRPNVSIAQIVHACDFIQRGDIVLPYVQRPAPPLKPVGDFDRFAPPNGKPLAMIITGKKFQQQAGNNDVIYINLGAEQGTKVGNYFRIFRYTGTQHETVFQTPRYAFDLEGGMAVPDVGIYGFGSVSTKYNWSNVPREDLGEGIVLRTGPNSSTVLITFAAREIYPGDYVELE